MKKLLSDILKFWQVFIDLYPEALETLQEWMTSLKHWKLAGCEIDTDWADGYQVSLMKFWAKEVLNERSCTCGLNIMKSTATDFAETTALIAVRVLSMSCRALPVFLRRRNFSRFSRHFCQTALSVRRCLRMASIFRCQSDLPNGNYSLVICN